MPVMQEGPLFAAGVKPPTKKNIAATVAFHGTKMASARLLS
jgi:hypothetical protein